MDYNTEREHLVIREYGRHIQNLINHAKSIEDPEERQKTVEGIIHLMGQLNPHLKNVADFKHKLWDHLFLIGGFDMDVDSPYDRPTEEIAKPSPGKVPYPKAKIKYRHYGKNVETMVTKAREFSEMEKRNGMTEVIGNFMKLACKNWSNEEVSDRAIKLDMEALSNNTLIIEEDMNMDAFLKSTTITPQKKSGQQKNYKGSGKRRGGSNSGRRSR